MKTRFILCLLIAVLSLGLAGTARADYPNPVPATATEQRILDVVQGWRTLFPGSVDSWEMKSNAVHVVYFRGTVLGNTSMQADLTAKLTHAGAASVRYSLVNVSYPAVEDAASALASRYASQLNSGALGMIFPTPGAASRSVTVAGTSAGVAGVRQQIADRYAGVPVVYQVGASPAPAGFDVYTAPGLYLLNGREWRTSCEQYSRTQRCRTEIKASTIVSVGGRYEQRSGWVFNNLTYAASPRTLWKGNPLGNAGQWTATDGRAWRTECDTPTTGHNGCRSYAMATLVSYQGGRYVQKTDWLFNNMVRFS